LDLGRLDSVALPNDKGEVLMKSKLIFAAITAASLLSTTVAFAESNGFTDKDRKKVLKTDRQSTASGAPDVTGTSKKHKRHRQYGSNGEGSKPMASRGIKGKPIHANEQGH
jgi:hypothetical protein